MQLGFYHYRSMILDRLDLCIGDQVGPRLLQPGLAAVVDALGVGNQRNQQRASLRGKRVTSQAKVIDPLGIATTTGRSRDNSAMPQSNEHDVSIHLAVPVDVLDHLRGPPHAGPVLIEYGDFECPSCAQAHAAIRILMDRFDHRFRFVFRHFPVAEFHPHALLAAEAAEAAGAQGRFWEMHDLLFAEPQHLGLADLHRRAAALTLDLPRFDAELADHVHLQRVQEHMASGRASHVRATPGLFFEGAAVDVSFGFERLAEAITARLAASR